MIIQHNILALNSHRQLGNNNSAVGKNLEKLSSGYRINRAGDDAAGLAISEKMRAQIKGLEVAKRNAQDGVSLVQTAEGALDEVHSMLKRMVELSTQSANGTYDDQSRAELQKEIKALNTEIDRIAEGTNFNDIKLLNGDLSTQKFEVTGVETTTQAALSSESVAELTADGTTKKVQNLSFIFSDGSKVDVNVEATDTALKVNGKDIKATVGVANEIKNDELAKAIMEAAPDLFSEYKVSAGAANNKLLFTSTKTGVDAPTLVAVNSLNGSAAKGTVDATATHGGEEDKVIIDVTKITMYDAAKGLDNGVFTVNGKKFAVAQDGVDLSKLSSDVTVINTDKTVGTALADVDAKNIARKIAAAFGETSYKDANVKVGDPQVILVDGGTKIELANKKGGLELQVGDTGADFNRLTVAVGNMDSVNLGVNDINISTIDGAREAIDKIKAAINQVSSTRSDLGAIQNRLEHTINSLGVTAENMTASESRIRDVDMAREMMMFTQNNVLSQAAQAMLAQANQQPQQILQLLR